MNTVQVIAGSALIAAAAVIAGCANNPAPQVSDQMKQQCLDKYKGMLEKPSQQTGDACWARFGYKFEQ